jgi:hypothetical protein
MDSVESLQGLYRQSSGTLCRVLKDSLRTPYRVPEDFVQSLLGFCEECVKTRLARLLKREE